MAQHDYVIDNSTGANVRADINNALLAISSNNSGSSAPSTTYALQSFANTTDSMLQLRNAANNAFVNLRKFDGTLPLPDGSVSSPSLFFDDDTNTGLFSSAADTLNFTTGGVERMELGTTTIFNEDGADVDFRIEGDTDANLFYVDAGNDRVGIGTTSPSVKTQISVSNTTAYSASTVDANQFQLSVTNTGANGVAGILLATEPSSGNGGHCGIRALSTGSGNSDLTFSTRGSSTQAERMRIDSSGIVYVGGVGASATAGILFFNDTSANGSKIAQVNGSSALSFHTGSSQPERLRIDSSGRLLINTTAQSTGTNSANAILTVNSQVGNATSAAILALRRGQASASIAQNNTIGRIVFCDTQAGEYAFIEGEADLGSNGVGDTAGRIAFSTSADGSSAPTERMRIGSDGFVGIGTTGDVSSSTGMTCFRVLGDNRRQLMLGTTSTAARALIEFFNPNGGVGSINTTGSSTAYNTSSDYRLKENVTAISDGITRLKTLKPSRFNFKSDSSTTVDGFLAHEVTAVPEAITGTKDEVDADNNPVYQGIDQSKLVPLLTAALQEAIAKIEVLETKVAALEAA